MAVRKPLVRRSGKIEQLPTGDTLFGLGTAAPLNVVTSSVDTTAGRLLDVGYGGLGALALNAAVLTDLNNINLPTGFYGYANLSTGAPPAATGPGVLLVLRFSNAATRQIARPVNGAADSTAVYERQVRTGPVYGTWVPVSNATLLAFAGLTGAADKGAYFTGATSMALFDLTSQARTFTAATTAAAQRTVLELTAVYTNLTLVSPFVWDAAGDAADYHHPSYAKVGDTVRLRGKVTLGGTHTTNATVNVKTVATLPVGFRPDRRKAFQVFWDTDSPLRFAYCLIFVNVDGTIVLLTPDGGQPYPFTEGHFPLDQIWYDLAT